MKKVLDSSENSLKRAHPGKVTKKHKKKKKASIVGVRKELKSAGSLHNPTSMEKPNAVSTNLNNAPKKKRKRKLKVLHEQLDSCTQAKTNLSSEANLRQNEEKLKNSPVDGQASVCKKRREKYQNSKNLSLREKMLGRLSAARFRFINEQLYTWDGEESPVFAKDPQSFSAYHSGFKQQTKLWPINPIDSIIKSIKKIPNHTTKVIADFGCGEAKLAHELSLNKVFSFDLVALNDKVTVADNANVKLYSNSVDIAVHCLSLMSSKISAYVKEANRVLKTGGLLKIAEVESRFENVDQFVKDVCKFNFKLVKKDLTHNLFYFMDFEKLGDIGVARKRKLPALTLQPCLYKKR